MESPVVLIFLVVRASEATEAATEKTPLGPHLDPGPGGPGSGLAASPGLGLAVSLDTWWRPGGLGGPSPGQHRPGETAENEGDGEEEEEAGQHQDQDHVVTTPVTTSRTSNLLLGRHPLSE